MKIVPDLFERLIPRGLSESEASNFSNRNYRRLETVLITIILAITLGPLLLAAGLSFKSYNQLFMDTEKAQVQWQLDGSIKSLESLLHNLESVVLFVARDDRYEELASGPSLEDLYYRLQRQYTFFSDLGVIDRHGIQKNYFGPYDLDGVDYSGEEWFRQVLEKGVYISKVYTGYRQIPHFALAVSKVEPEERRRWVLRATIDAGKLQKYVDTIKTDAAEDFFLIDEDGILQTSSLQYGEPLMHFDSDWHHGVHHIVTGGGETAFQAIGPIAHTPWSLVIINRNYIHDSDWKKFRKNLLAIVLVCIVGSAAVVVFLVRTLTGRLQVADELQINMLKEAEQTEKLASIGRLAAGVGHEINNPLAIIDQRTGLMEDLLELSGEFAHKEAVQESLAGINRSVERCKVITHRLLGFARRTSIAAESLQVNQIIAEVLQFLDSEMLYNKIRLELELSEGLPDVVSDRTQLQQVFLNIINNAIDAIDRDGMIRISTNSLAGDIRVVIEDDGPGIDDTTLKHIFEPFYTTKETGKGTGLGLSITFGLLKRLGGDITVRSRVGIGTAFTITIPLECNIDEESN